MSPPRQRLGGLDDVLDARAHGGGAGGERENRLAIERERGREFAGELRRVGRDGEIAVGERLQRRRDRPREAEPGGFSLSRRRGLGLGDPPRRLRFDALGAPAFGLERCGEARRDAVEGVAALRIGGGLEPLAGGERRQARAEGALDRPQRAAERQQRPEPERQGGGDDEPGAGRGQREAAERGEGCKRGAGDADCLTFPVDRERSRPCVLRWPCAAALQAARAKSAAISGGAPGASSRRKAIRRFSASLSSPPRVRWARTHLASPASISDACGQALLGLCVLLEVALLG